ncbi:MAG: hypothetical protein HWN65_07830 [Candidatus Helarchaeota archaeon]|nr:hypothetical protein [Candidatus Helarchaeota archaeon]
MKPVKRKMVALLAFWVSMLTPIGLVFGTVGMFPYFTGQGYTILFLL